MSRLTSVAVLSVMVVLLSSPAWATPTENQRIRALPAGKVVVDGKFDDWDLSGGIFGCENVETAAELGRMWFHTMYDADNFYVLVRAKDATPLQGDNLSMRMNTGQLVHMGLNSDGKTGGSINIQYGPHPNYTGRLNNALDEGAKMAAAADADGKGYTLEISLPWKMLTVDGAPFKAGQTARLWVGLRLERAWSIGDLYAPPNPDRVFVWRSNNSWGFVDFVGQNNVSPALCRLQDGRTFPVRMKEGQLAVDWTGLIDPVEFPGHLPITFTLEKDSYVTVAIDDANGQRVRNLAANHFFTAGEHTIMWDGLADNSASKPGDPVPPGKYVWKGLIHDPLHLVYKGVFHNAGTPPWTSMRKDHDWGGDFGPPVAAACDDQRVYLGWGSGEASTQLIAVDFTGKKLWGARRGWSSTRLLSLDGPDIYCGPDKNNLYRVDAATGAFKPFPSTGVSDMAPPLLPEQQEVKGDTTTQPAPYLMPGETKPRVTAPDAMTTLGGKLYMSYTDLNRVGVLDIQTGKFDKIFKIDAPGRWAVTADKGLLLITGKKVVRMSPADGTTSDVIAAGLEDPKSLALDKAGNIYICEWGTRHQVLVFDPAGKAVRAIGKAGGRPRFGPWQADGLWQPLGITVTPDGRVWVGESCSEPKRWTIWTAQGTLEKELFGPSHYGSDGGALNPEDPYLGIGVECEWRVDPKTGEGKCLGVMPSASKCNVPWPADSHFSRYVKSGDTWYVAQGLHRYYSMLKVFRKKADGDFQLAAVMGNTYEKSGNDPKPLAYSQHPFFKDRPDEVFAWADANGDGQVQEDELQFRRLGPPVPATQPGTRAPKAPPALRIRGAWQHIGVNGNDFTTYFPMSDQSIWRFPFAGFTASGAPKFDLAAAGPVGDGRYSGGYGNIVPSWDGDVLVAQSNPIKGVDAATGKLLWTYPNDWNGVHGSHAAPAAAPGRMRGTLATVGSAKVGKEELFTISTNVGEWHCLTKDGLYVSSLFTFDPIKVKWPEQAVPGVLLDNNPPGLGAEDFGGFFTGTTDGRAFIQAGKTGFWIVELTGADTIRRLGGGSLEQTEAGVSASKDMYSVRLQKTAGTKTAEVIAMTPKIDGDLSDWPADSLNAFQYSNTGDTRMAAGIAYDKDNLYVAYRIADPAATWKNAATDLRDMYCRGDTVDLQLGVNPAANPKRASAVEGDLRLSIGNLAGKPTAVIYREKGPALDGKPATFGSGVIHAFPVDSVRLVEEAQIQVTVTDKASYIVEAAIPLKALGLEPKSGLELQGDFGVTCSNTDGTDTTQRVYWSNQNTGMVADEVFELKIEPRNWGTIRFK